MNLSRKVTMIVILAFLISGLLCLGIQRIFIMPSFISLEKETAIKNAERVLEAINREFSQLSPSVSDWAYWTDTYNYVKGQNETYEEINLVGHNALNDLNVNYMGIYDADGNAVWSRAIDLPTGNVLNLGLLSGLKLPAGHPLMQLKNLTDEVSGIIATSHAPMMVIAKPILTSENKGPIAGTFILGRFLDAAAIKNIGLLTKLPITYSKPKQEVISQDLVQTGHNHGGLVYTALQEVMTQDNWQIYTTLIDLYKKPILALQIDTAREISAQGAKAVDQSLWSLVAAGLLVMFVLWLLLQLTVLEPITKLTEHAMNIGSDGKLQDHIEIERNDEIGILSKTFNQMVDRLAESRQRLVDQSYRSGIAEMASGVLHNIRNAITPLNVRLSTLKQTLRAAPLTEIEQALAELADPTTPPERRADLIQFMDLATEELGQLIKSTYGEVELSIQQVAQIEEFIAYQKRLTHSQQVIEPVEMAKVISDAEVGLAPKFRDVITIKIANSVADYGKIAAARAALQQVVANVLINAAESIITSSNNAGCITVTAEQKYFQGKPMVDYSFIDNGEGVLPSNLNRLFERGFSTKKIEGAGYGLHWSANTIQSFGGTMFVESAGIGHGTTIHILLQRA